jgi:hypothetical protein
MMANNTDLDIIKEHVSYAQNGPKDPLDLAQSPLGDQAATTRSSTMSRPSKGKQRDLVVLREPASPRHFLNLPDDILRLIVKEVTAP